MRRSRGGQRGGVRTEHHGAEGPHAGEDQETTRAEGREREETQGITSKIFILMMFGALGPRIPVDSGHFFFFFL